jgi:hypothetical protein
MGMRGQAVDLRRFVGELESWTDEEIALVCAHGPREFGALYLERVAELDEKVERFSPYGVEKRPDSR